MGQAILNHIKQLHDERLTAGEAHGQVLLRLTAELAEKENACAALAEQLHFLMNKEEAGVEEAVGPGSGESRSGSHLPAGMVLRCLRDGRSLAPEAVAATAAAHKSTQAMLRLWRKPELLAAMTAAGIPMPGNLEDKNDGVDNLRAQLALYWPGLTTDKQEAAKAAAAAKRAELEASQAAAAAAKAARCARKQQATAGSQQQATVGSKKRQNVKRANNSSQAEGKNARQNRSC